MMRKVLSLDLGITTGYCVLLEGAIYVECGTIVYDNPTQYAHDLTYLLARHTPVGILIESPVLIARGELQGKLAKIMSVTDTVVGIAHADVVQKIQPAQWKDSPFKKHSVPETMRRVTTHERDAYRMCMWWLKTRQPLSIIDE